jgi:hypothetical protein
MLAKEPVYCILMTTLPLQNSSTEFREREREREREKERERERKRERERERENRHPSNGDYRVMRTQNTNLSTRK